MKFTRRLCFLLALLCAPVLAGTISVTLTQTNADITINRTLYDGATFGLSFTADSSAVTSYSGYYYYTDLPADTATLTVTSSTGSLVYSGTISDAISFGTGALSGGAGLVLGDFGSLNVLYALVCSGASCADTVGYNWTSNLTTGGTGEAGEWQTTPLSTTSRDAVYLTATHSGAPGTLTFTVTGSDTPEPATFLLALPLLGIFALRPHRGNRRA